MIDKNRLARLKAAERRANWRDWDKRYGSHRRPAYGFVAARTSRKKQAKPESDVTVGVTLFLLLLLGYILLGSQF